MSIPEGDRVFDELVAVGPKLTDGDLDYMSRKYRDAPCPYIEQTLLENAILVRTAESRRTIHYLLLPEIQELYRHFKAGSGAPGSQPGGGRADSGAGTTIHQPPSVGSPAEVLEPPNWRVDEGKAIQPGTAPPISGPAMAPPQSLLPAFPTDSLSPGPGHAQPKCDIVLGAKELPKQYGVLGVTDDDRAVALDLDGTNVVSLFGVPGSGKSYTLGTILEMALMPVPALNKLSRPLAGVVLHYSRTPDYRPEFVSMRQPNDRADELQMLHEQYRASPRGLPEVIILTPRDKVREREREFPGVAVYPIAFHAGEIDLGDCKFLMRAGGNDSLYMNVVTELLRMHRNSSTLNLDTLNDAILESELSETQKKLARSRLRFVSGYVDQSGCPLREYIRPGRLVVVDLRDELIESRQAWGLFAIMLKLFVSAQQGATTFNKLFVLDEAHKYMNSEFAVEIVTVIREMRHRGATVLVASQDPPSVPSGVVALSSRVVLHKANSPEWLRQVQRDVAALRTLTADQLSALRKGQTYVWSREATEPNFERRAMRVTIRPRVTKHGGETKKAVD